jgi:catechol 2,3-dioxygenase-like lactoylglutathione lyase family enzyme
VKSSREGAIVKRANTTTPKNLVRFATDGNFAIHVTDLEKAENFYGRILGFKLLKRTGERLVYNTGDITLYIVKDDKTIPFIPALEVDDYDKAKQYLVKKGCKINKEWPEERALYFEDPFGIIIDIVEK